MAGDSFSLDSRLADTGHFLLDWPLCRVLLSTDANYPWLVLVPRRGSLRELHELGPDDLHQLVEEITRASRALERAFEPTKINVAALGNVVPQLHVHVIARYEDDRAWPHPVWGRVPAKPYAPELLETRSSLLKRELA